MSNEYAMVDLIQYILIMPILSGDIYMNSDRYENPRRVRLDRLVGSAFFASSLAFNTPGEIEIERANALGPTPSVSPLFFRDVVNGSCVMDNV